MNLDEKDVDIPMDPDDHPEDALISNRRHPRGPSLNRGRQSRIPVTLHIFVLYAVIAGLVVVGLTLLNMPDTCHDPSQGIYSPASDAVVYHKHVFQENFVTKGPYMGRPDGLPDEGVPTDQTDALWEDLYQFGVSQIPYDQARQLPNATELIPATTDQYVIELDVFHQLHCLNAIRKTLYPERYWDTYDDYYIKDGSPPGRGQRNYTSTDAKHYDHCLDSIRQSIMCHGDIATVYWRWKENKLIPVPWLQITHTCRNFEKLHEWGKAHQVKSDPSWPKGPENSPLWHQNCPGKTC